MEPSLPSALPITGLSLGDEISRIIVEESGFSGVCTDERLVVIKAFGNASAYLKNELFNFNLNDLLPDKVSLLVKAAGHKALISGKRIMISGLEFAEHGTEPHRLVNIICKPLQIGQPNNQYLLILFSESSKLRNPSVIKSTEVERLTREHLRALESELEDARQKLELAYEQIDASNENMQSFNEELLSANEEMQSANEELQSVNEESRAINKEQEITNAELTELNDDLNNYFRSNVNGQIFVDRSVLLKKNSPAAVKLINIRECDIGRPLSDISTNLRSETLIIDIERVILEGGTIIREAEALDGKIYQVMTMPYIRKDSREIDGAIVSFYDISELKILLQKLDVSNKSLQESVKVLEVGKEKVSEALAKEKELSILKSRFVAMASHEFKTPLSSIQLSSILIEKYAKQYLNEDINKHIVKINITLNNLNNILNDFLSLERLEEGKIIPVPTLFNLPAFTEDVREEMQQIARQNQQIIYQHTGTANKVNLDQSLLRNCATNLIVNAIKYSAEDSIIDLSTEITESEITMTVKDQGIGIPEEDQKHLFKPFFRANNTEDIPGTGLGLNIVARYIRLMNGQISFESLTTGGTTFKITFPVLDHIIPK
ncbi:MAG: ATP-binding protein [Sphingobacteriaceae bacterium]